MKKATRNDVAKLAGVSTAVVSYVLNGHNYVSEEKRKAVLDAINKLDYTPNRFAKSLRTRHSESIALIGDTLQTELFESLARSLFDKGYYASLFFAQQNDKFIRRIIDGQFDAVLITSNGFSTEQLNRIANSGIPMILYKSRDFEPLAPQIVSMSPDIYGGFMMAMKYLAGKGHRRIAYVPPLLYRTEGLGGSDYRARAYTNSVHSLNLMENSEFVCVRTESESVIEQEIWELLHDRPKDQQPTAILISDDELAAHIMSFLQSKNIVVPDDVAVMGWGNIPIASITTPRLTTVDSDIKVYATEVADALVQMATGHKPKDKLFSVRLIPRESA